MKNNDISYGSWLTKPYNTIVEVISKSGFFQWLTIDIEHSTISLYQVEDMLRIIQLSGLEAYVRLSKNDPVLIKRILDAGADGIIVPMVNSISDVEKAVNACFYPPKGSRCAGLARVHNYEPQGFKNYIKTKEKDTKIMVQIEHIDAIDKIDDIFSSKDIYGYFIGPYDLSASMGKPGEYKSDDVVKVLDTIKKSAIKNGVRPGFHVVEPDYYQIENKKREGYRLLAISTDMLFLLKGMNSCFLQG